jgi:hypothetical protein
MNTKICTKCGIEKLATTEFFHKSSTGKYGFHARCKVCICVKKTTVYEFPASKVCSCCNKEFAATTEFFSKHPEGKYGLRSLCKVCKGKQRNKRRNERHKTDIQFKLANNLRTRLYAALQGKSKSAPTFKLLGCTVEYLKNYLEGFFTNKMNWENYGTYWVIDHIVSIKSFDLTDPAKQRSCFNYLNLQPLEKEINESLGGREKPSGGYGYSLFSN